MYKMVVWENHEILQFADLFLQNFKFIQKMIWKLFASSNLWLELKNYLNPETTN